MFRWRDGTMVTDHINCVSCHQITFKKHEWPSIQKCLLAPVVHCLIRIFLCNLLLLLFTSYS